MIKGKGQRLIPEELLKYLEALKNKYPDAVDLVEANPTLEGGEESLSSVLINGTKYAVGGGSEVHLYRHRIYEKSANSMILEFIIIDSNETPYTETTMLTFLEENSSEAVPYSANGRYKTGDNEYQILGVYKYDNVSYPFGIEYIVDVNTVNKTGFPSFTRFTDTVTQIL